MEQGEKCGIATERSKSRIPSTRVKRAPRMQVSIMALFGADGGVVVAPVV